MRLSLNIFHGLILFVRCEICPNVKSGVLHPTMYIALQSCSALLIIIVMYTYCTLCRLKPPTANRAVVRCTSTENCATRVLYKCGKHFPLQSLKYLN